MKKLARDENGFATIISIVEFIMNPVVLAVIGIVIILLAIDVYSTNPGFGYAGFGLLLAGVGGTLTVSTKWGIITGATGVIMMMLSFSGLV